MSDLLQPTNSSRENLSTFIDSIEDDDLKELIRNHLDTVLEIGRPNGENDRQAFFEALSAILDKRISEAKL